MSFAHTQTKQLAIAYQDLAKGAGGDYRYLLPISDTGNPNKITSLRLCRSSSAVTSPPDGYSGMSANINSGRDKDFLYLLYQTVSAREPTFLAGIDVMQLEFSAFYAI